MCHHSSSDCVAKDMGATGIASMELSDVDKLADQMIEADTVMVGDEPMAVEDILKDENISALVMGHLQGDPELHFRMIVMEDLDV